MQLLLKRRQKEDGLKRIKFALWAKFELTAEEQALIDKCQVRNAILDEGNTRRDLIRAFKYAIGGGMMKTWGGAEVIDITPERAPTGRVVEEPARAAS